METSIGQTTSACDLELPVNALVIANADISVFREAMFLRIYNGQLRPSTSIPRTELQAIIAALFSFISHFYSQTSLPHTIIAKMLFTTFSIALISVNAVLGTPTSARKGTVSILEHIHAKTPIVWNTTVNHDGSSSKATIISNAVWEAAESDLSIRSLATSPAEPGLSARWSTQKYSCFGSGSWAKQRVLDSHISNACNNIGKFSLLRRKYNVGRVADVNHSAQCR
jgi:hypothetical protein